ncbi:MAG: oxidative demethylase AlkB [Pseudomonadota bacterium]|nr:oxidative demethylase AlkB [Pseudomonadota bacterium]
MDLFDDLPLPPDAARTEIAPGAVLLSGFARDAAATLLKAVGEVIVAAPPQHLQTPGGYTMSVQTTSCGRLGWVSDRHGYRYATHSPHTHLPWPAMPTCIAALARHAAQAAGYPGFEADACLINTYAPGAKMSLHQDKDERDLRAPIVSVSLGLPAVFQLGGLQRTAPTQRLRLAHGDVLVWGGPSRLAFHGVLALADGHHPLLGRRRVNLTFRKAA